VNKGFFLNLLSVRLGINYTQEQIDFMSDFTKPVISFSSPGTGKTMSAIGGLLAAELADEIPGDTIYALSFTNAATGELALRHEKACKKLNIKQTVHFNTLHSICKNILAENYERLGFHRFKISSPRSFDDMQNIYETVAAENNFSISPWQIWPITRAINDLNASLIHDANHIQTKKVFKDTCLTYEQFAILRKTLYEFDRATNTIAVGNILPLTLELLIRHPEVGEEFKKKCRILLIDEFQDMSLLMLNLVSRLTDNLVAIGDMKQQIYAFNGACQEIVKYFMEYYPNARVVELTESFRCANNIADYATKIIAPNVIEGYDKFKGNSQDGTVTIHNDLSVGDVCQEISKMYYANRRVFKEDYMFLVRNNSSLIPVIEELYKLQIPCRVSSYVKATEIPVIRDLFQLALFAYNPKEPSNFDALKLIIPEFRRCGSYLSNPLYLIYKETGEDPFEINYHFKDAAGAMAMSKLFEARQAILNGEMCSEVFNILYPIYKDLYLKEYAYKLEAPPSTYINNVAPLTRCKTFEQFMRDEVLKENYVRDWNMRREGVRCYTLHAAKGLEADYVYILDANEGIIPNLSKLNEMFKQDCRLEAAREVRNERNLLYVAATRAKKELHISYTGELAKLLCEPDYYASLDKLYQEHGQSFLDVDSFKEFIKRKGEENCQF